MSSGPWQGSADDDEVIARDYLLVTGEERSFEFLDDLRR
jgi:hypothetical protein